MPIIVNCSKVSTLVGCSRANLSKMWKIEKDEPGHYGFFTSDGKIDISNPEFIDRYGDHTAEWKAANDPALAPKRKPGRPKGSKNKTLEKQKAPKTRTPKQREQDQVKAEREAERLLSDDNDEVKTLQKNATIAKYEKTILDKEKAEMELRKARASLAELQTIGETCIGYLIALNQELLDQPRSFIDELCAGIKAGKSKTDLTDIARKPAMIAISEAQEFIKKEIARYKRDVRSENK